MKPSSRILQSLIALALLALTGCAVSPATLQPAKLSLEFSGAFHGGQQPIAGVTVQLYAAGTNGDGSQATPLLTRPVFTDSNGAFSLTGAYTCPADSLVYLVGTGGDPGVGVANPVIALMAAIGPCSSLTPSSFINVNELTTVAALNALLPFMPRVATNYLPNPPQTELANIGSSSTDVNLLTAAFALANQYVNLATGTTPGPNVPAGASVPINQINTIADVLAACVNSSGGTYGDGSTCGTLIAGTSEFAFFNIIPADTITATYAMAGFSLPSIAAVYNLVSPKSPFQPTDASVPGNLAVHFISSDLGFPGQHYDFGNTTPIGSSSAPMTATLTNSGSGPITISAIAFRGDTPRDYSQTNNCPTTLAGGASCTVSIVFTPLRMGYSDATLTVFSSANNSTTDATLVGVVGPSNVGRYASVSPATISTYPQTVTITNRASSPLPIFSIATTPGFTQTNNCGSSLFSQSICTITVSAVLAPNTLPLSYKGILYIESAQGFDSVTLAAGTDPVFDFGTFAVGTLSTGLTDPVSYGTGSLSGANPGDFLLVNGGTGVQFKPTATGLRLAILTAGNNTTTYLAGTGTTLGSPSGFFTQLSSFGATIVEQTPYTSNFKFTNSGLTTLAFNGNAAFTSSSSEAVVTANNCPATLAPTASCTLTVQYTAVTFPFRPAVVLTATDAASNTQFTTVFTIPTVTSKPTSFSSAVINFGALHLNTTSTMSLTVNNPDRHPLYDFYSGSPYPFTLVSGQGCSAPICNFQYTFAPINTPQGMGQQVANYAIDDYYGNHSSTPFVVTGYGGIPNFVFNPPAFVDRPVGTTSSPVALTVTNIGDGPGAMMYPPPPTGANASDFIPSCPQYQICSNPVAPNATVLVGDYSFSPSATGNRTATVQIAVDFNRNRGNYSYGTIPPATVTLTGTAF